jgi:hypothetical protein
MKSKARCFASTLSMTTVAVQTVYDSPGFLGTPFPERLSEFRAFAPLRW